MSAFTFGDHKKRGPARPANWRELQAAKHERGRIERARTQAAEDELITRALAWGRPFAILDLVETGCAANNAHNMLARLERNGKAERAGKLGRAQLWRLIGVTATSPTPAVAQPSKATDDLGTPNSVEIAWRAEVATMTISREPDLTFSVVARAEMAENFK